MRSFWGWLIATALALLLGACSSVPIVFDRQIVGDAISLQLQQTQSQLSSQLRLSEDPTWTVEGVKVTDNAPATIQGLPGYHLQGTYTLVIDFPSGRKTRRKQDFDLYIQGQKEGKTWRLARYVRDVSDPEPRWKTYLIAPQGYD